MTPKITQAVILDLMPLYLAGEVSDDTRALVETYLANDPELAQMAKEAGTLSLPDQIPDLTKKENAMEAYKEARRLMLLRTLAIAGAITFIASFGLMLILGAALLFFAR